MAQFIRDFMVILLCEERIEQRDPNPMEPWITYLEDGAPLTPRLRNWLIALMKPDKTQRHYLKLKTRPGRPPNTTFDRDSLINERAAELDGTVITRAFCEALKTTTGMSSPTIEKIGQRTIFRLGWPEWDETGDDYVEVELTLQIGKTLNNLQVYSITAAEFEVSVSTVKRVLAASELALAAGD